jgi:hypothetical protein
LNTLFRKFRSLIYHVRFSKELITDKIKGLDFTTPVSREQAGTASLTDALYYESSAFVPEIHKAFTYLQIKATDAVLDYGSGKGAVLYTLSRYPFRLIRGIEFSQSLADIARKNMTKLNLRNVEIITGDASAYTDIDEFNYFYFFNPFGGKVFSDVIHNIINSIAKVPRDVHIVYYHPKCHLAIMETGAFAMEKNFVDGARSLNIYRNIRI